MTDSPATSRFASVGNVPADYRHYVKVVEPADGLALPDAYLKWYDVHRADLPIPDAIRDETRAFIRGEAEAGRLAISGELGFAILHRCGESFYFLIVATWRHANEMWETVYTCDFATQSEFVMVPQGTHLEVICVWELGAVVHERAAWTRYLHSARDEAAKVAYVEDRFRGEV